MPETTRRGFLRAAGGTGVACAGVVGATGVASAAVTVTGRLVAHDGASIADRNLKNYGDSQFNVYTDADGYFSAEAAANARLNLVLYKGDRSTLLVPDMNGVPHLYTYGD